MDTLMILIKTDLCFIIRKTLAQLDYFRWIIVMELSGYHLGIGTYWEVGTISGIIAFSGTQALDSQRVLSHLAKPITRKDNHVVDPYIVGQNVTISNSQVTTAIVWNKFPGSRSTRISAGTKFRVGWARAGFSLGSGLNYTGNPASYPISSITPVVTALTDFNTDTVKSYTQKKKEVKFKKDSYVLIETLDSKLILSPFNVLLRRSPRLYRFVSHYLW